MFFKVKKKINVWDRLTPEERIYKFSELLDKSIDNVDVIDMNETYTYYKKNYFNNYEIIELFYTNYNKISDDKKINYLLKINKNIIPVISTKNLLKTKLLRIDKYTSIFNGNMVYKDIGKLNIASLLIPNTYINNYIIPIDNYDNISISRLNNIIDKYKYDIILQNYKYTPHEFNYMSYYKKGVNTEEINNYINTKFSYNISIPILDKIKKQKIDYTLDDNFIGRSNINVNKEYDIQSFDNKMIVYDNTVIYRNILRIFKLSVLQNTENLSSRLGITKFIYDIDNIRSTIISLFQEDKSKIISQLIVSMDKAITILSIFISIYIHNLNGIISIDIKHDNYKEYKKSKYYNSLIKSRNTQKHDYKKYFLLYLMEILYKEEYFILKNNNIKMELLFNINNNVNNINKLKFIVTETKSIYTNKSNIEKIINTISYSKIDIKSLQNYKNIKHIIETKDVTDINIKKFYDRDALFKINSRRSKYIDVFKTSNSKYNIEYTKIKKFDIPLHKDNSLNNSPNSGNTHKLINKLKKYIEIKYNMQVIIDNLGFFNKRYEDQGRENKDQFLYYKNTLLNTMKKEWIFMKKLDDSDKNIIEIYNDYIINVKTAKEIYKSINYYSTLFNTMDISETSVEREKIKLMEIRDERMNIYYNLTPEEKLELDKLIFGSEEWNNEIDNKLEIDEYINSIDAERNLKKIDTESNYIYSGNNPDDDEWNYDFGDV